MFGRKQHICYVHFWPTICLQIKSPTYTRRAHFIDTSCTGSSYFFSHHRSDVFINGACARHYYTTTTETERRDVLINSYNIDSIPTFWVSAQCGRNVFFYMFFYYYRYYFIVPTNTRTSYVRAQMAINPGSGCERCRYFCGYDLGRRGTNRNENENCEANGYETTCKKRTSCVFVDAQGWRAVFLDIVASA